MAEIPVFIPDASTTLRWLIPERELHAEATRMLEDFAGGRIGLLAPYHFPMEVGSGLRWQVANHQTTHAEARRRFDRFLAIGIPTRDVQGLLENAFENCQRYSISIRDSLYVTLAQVYEVPFITTDGNLLRATAHLPHGRHLREYEPLGRS